MPTLPIALVALLMQSPSAPSALPFAGGTWDLQGGATLARDGGRDVLQVESGFGFRRDVRLEDGTIDFDVKLTDRRSFVYVYFRAEKDGEREEFYLRPHKSNLPDALQYAPVWQGRSAWQLYHGPGGTAPAGFSPGAWTHVRVAVKGRSAALFVGDMTRPALLVPRLAREPHPGYLALGGFLPAGVPGSGPIATFANVTVAPGTPAFDFDAALAGNAPSTRSSGLVTQWSVSRAFAPRAEAADAVLPDADTISPFQAIAAEANGLVPLHRHVTMPEGSNAAAAVARIQVRAETGGVRAFDLGYSDIAAVFLNGTPVYRGDARYSFDQPRREGLIGFDQARLYLPLRAGENELAVVVSDGFGGWGIMGRFADASGLTISAR